MAVLATLRARRPHPGTGTIREMALVWGHCFVD
jgi:hypothetical protein